MNYRPRQSPWCRTILARTSDEDRIGVFVERTDGIQVLAVLVAYRTWSTINRASGIARGRSYQILKVRRMPLIVQYLPAGIITKKKCSRGREIWEIEGCLWRESFCARFSQAIKRDCVYPRYRIDDVVYE